jgi:hypothetical protein
MKRFLSILLSVLMVVSVLAIVASCSGNETDTTTAATTAETTTAKQDDTTKQTDVVTTVTEKVTTTAETTTEKTTTTAETTTETTKQTTAETTTEETTTTAEETTTTAAATTTAKLVETTTLPVFARFDFGTDTYAAAEGLTSHDYLTEVLIYDDSALMINFEKDYWDIWTVSPYDPESVTFENGSLKNMRFGVVFNDLVTFDFDDDIVHGWGSWERYPYSQPTEKSVWHGTHQYMQVRMVNDTTNNIWGIRYINTGDGTYYTTEVIGNLYLQGGEPESATDYRRTCEKSSEWRVYTYDLMMVGGIASGRGWSAVSGKDGKIDDGVDNYYDQVQMSIAKGWVGGSNISWQPKKGFTGLEFNFFGGVYTYAYDEGADWDDATKKAWETAQEHLKLACDTRENIVAGMNVKVDYIIFGCSPEQCDEYKSYMEQDA